MSDKIILRGDIYYAVLDPVIGSEQGGTRPALVLQNNAGNRYGRTVIVAAITSKKKKALPTHAPIDSRALPKDSIVLLEQIRTIDKQRLCEYIAHIDNAQMKNVERAIDISFGMNYLEGLQ